MIKVIIDDLETQVEDGSTILNVAKEMGIDIPTLCYHEALTPYTACRLCTVEIIRGGRSKMVTACNYPIREEIEIKTNSERVVRARRMILELLLARCPHVPIIQDLAREMGVEEPRFKKEDEPCILCGLCVRTCSEIVGVNAVSFVGRGIERGVDTPFHIASDDCIGCGACAYICPTEAVKIEERDGIREIERWHASHELRKCRVCGDYFAPEVQLSYIEKILGLPKDTLDTCPNCKP